MEGSHDRKILHKALRISRGLALATGAVVICTVVLGAATVALAAALAAAPGDQFRLGKVNAISKVTKLVGEANSPRLVTDNNGSGVALRLLVEPGKPPMQVNSSRKVARLNADRLDNKNASDFYAADSKVADSSHADQADNATSAQNATNADKLNGKDSTQFVSGYNVVTQSSDFNSNPLRSQTAFCPGQQVVLGGGAAVSTSATVVVKSSSLNVAMISTGPSGSPPRAWQATADEMVDTNSNWRIIVYAICANTAP